MRKNKIIRSHQIKSALYFIFLVFFISGCANKPQPHSPDLQIRLKDAFESTQQVGNIDIADSLLGIFSDDNLTKIIHSIQNQNLDIQSAQNILRANGYATDTSRADLFPSVDINTDAGRSKSSSGAISNQYAISLDSSWEIDLWGKIRDRIGVALIDEGIQKETLNNTQQSIIAQAIQTYFSAINARKIAQIYGSEYDSFKLTEKTIQDQFALGLSSGDDLDNAIASSYNALQNLQAAKKDERDAKRILNILMGQYPTTDIEISKDYPALNKTVAAGIPSDVLLRRPDIKIAYLKVVQSDTQALISYKDMFPSLVLSGSFGRTSNELNEIVSNGLNIWNFVGQLAQPLFDAGLRKARLNENSALADAAYDQYQASILSAMSEIEGTLDNEKSLDEQLDSAQKAYTHAASAERRATENYANGVNDIFDLLDARRNRYGALRIVENLKLQRYQNRVTLALNLGKAY